MAILTGGLHGRPAGNVAGVIYGGARGRRGKLVTARELVIPANPNTAAQQVQRNKFSDCLDIVRAYGPTMYQDDWNRSIGQLPGFQSLMSILLDNMDASGDLTAPAVTPLGDLHVPDTITFLTGVAAGAVTMVWSQETGNNGTTGDEMQVYAVNADRADRTPVYVGYEAGTRAAGAPASELDGFGSGNNVLMVAWMQGAGAADGLLSAATWGVATAAV